MRLLDGPKWMMVPLVMVTLICVIIGFMEPIVKGEPYHWMSEEIIAE